MGVRLGFGFGFIFRFRLGLGWGWDWDKDGSGKLAEFVSCDRSGWCIVTGWRLMVGAVMVDSSSVFWVLVSTTDGCVRGTACTTVYWCRW